MKIEYNLTLDEILNASGGQAVVSGNGAGPLVFNEIFTDSRENFSKNAVFIALKGKNFNGEDFVSSVFEKGACCAVVSWDFLEKNDLSRYPDKIVIAVDDAVSALGGIAGFYLSCFNTAKKIAITGSCGKTTTKEMVYRIIASKYGKEKVLKNNYNYNNLIGVPKSILGLSAGHEYLILEIGTNKKGEIGKLSGIISPDVGAITNIGRSHLLEFKNLEGVFEEKAALVPNIKAGGCLIINADDDTVSGKSADLRKMPDLNVMSFGRACGVIEKTKPVAEAAGFGSLGGPAPDIICESAAAEKNSSLLTVSFRGRQYRANVPFRGAHLVSDLLCALLIAYVCGVGMEEGLAAMKDFVLPEGRMQFIPSSDGEYMLVNDSYNSNPDSLSAALNSIKEYYPRKKKILVLGDMLELGDSSEAEHYKAGRDAAGHADYIFYKGNFTDSFERGLLEAGFAPEKFFIFGDKAVFKEIFKKIDKRDSVILIKGSRGMKLEEYFEDEIMGKK